MKKIRTLCGDHTKSLKNLYGYFQQKFDFKRTRLDISIEAKLYGFDNSGSIHIALSHLGNEISMYLAHNGTSIAFEFSRQDPISYKSKGTYSKTNFFSGKLLEEDRFWDVLASFLQSDFAPANEFAKYFKKTFKQFSLK